MDSQQKSGQRSVSVTETITQLLERSNELRFVKPGRAFTAAEQAARLANSIENQELLAQGLSIIVAMSHTPVEYERSLSLLTELHNSNSKKTISLLLDIIIARFYIRQGNRSKGIEHYHSVLKKLEKKVLPEEVDLRVAVCNGLAYAYLRSGESAEGAKWCYEAMELSLSYPLSPANRISTFSSVAGLALMMVDKKRTRHYYLQALEACNQAGMLHERIHFLIELGRTAVMCNDFSEALGYQRQAAHEADSFGDTRGLIRSLVLAGQVHYNLKYYKKARKYWLDALGLFGEDPDPYYHGEVLFAIAMVDVRSGDARKGIDSLLNILAYACEQDLTSKQMVCHSVLMEGYERIGEFKEAFEHQRRYMELFDQVKGIQQQRTVIEMEFTSRIGELEQRLEESRGEVRSLKSKIEEKESSIVETTRSYMVNRSGNGRESRKHQAGTLNSTSSWKEFARQFDTAHDRFGKTLTRQFPDLTATELKVCYLLRGGLSSKEIAHTLTISPPSVDVYRYRIRKKLLLVREINLVSYLNTI